MPRSSRTPGAESGAFGPPFRRQPVSPDQGASWLDQTPVAAEAPARSRVGGQHTGLRTQLAAGSHGPNGEVHRHLGVARLPERLELGRIAKVKRATAGCPEHLTYAAPAPRQWARTRSPASDRKVGPFQHSGVPSSPPRKKARISRQKAPVRAASHPTARASPPPTLPQAERTAAPHEPRRSRTRERSLRATPARLSFVLFNTLPYGKRGLGFCQYAG